jgi:hypothetical protein
VRQWCCCKSRAADIVCRIPAPVWSRELQRCAGSDQSQRNALGQAAQARREGDVGLIDARPPVSGFSEGRGRPGVEGILLPSSGQDPRAGAIRGQLTHYTFAPARVPSQWQMQMAVVYAD